MSQDRADAIRQRQQRLLVRSALLRRQVAMDASVLASPLALADQVHHLWQWLRANPAVPLAGLAAFAVLRPRRAWRWASRIWWGWRTVRRLQRQWLPPA